MRLYHFQNANKTLSNPLLRIVIAIIICIVAIAAIVLMAYLLFIGAIVGLVLYAVIAIKNKFFPHTNRKQKQGRIINMDDHD